jgi:signal transduction histidine kinase
MDDAPGKTTSATARPDPVEPDRMLLASARLIESVVGARSRDELLAAVCTGAVALARVAVAWIGVVEPDAHPLEPVACCGPARGFLDRIGAAWQAGAREPLAVIRAVQEGRPYACRDVQADPQLPWRDAARAHGLRAYAAFPLVHGGAVLGALHVCAAEPDAFDGAVATALARLAGSAAAALDRLAAAARRDRCRQQTEAHLRRCNSELEQRIATIAAEHQRIREELASFTYTVSHDLKSPLRSIDGYSMLLLDEHAGSLDPAGQTFLDMIREATQRMGQLLDDLMVYTRVERCPLSPGPFDPRVLIDELLAEQGQEIAARRVIVTVSIPWPCLAADREGLAVALRHLLENALKFTRDTPAPRIEIGGRDEAGARVLWVRDNGCGFDMRHHDRIFEIFHRLHRTGEYPGTGLGLALVRKIVQRMGGRTWAESRPGAGAIFYLALCAGG